MGIQVTLWGSRKPGLCDSGACTSLICLLFLPAWACWPSLQFLTEVVSDSLRRATCLSLLALGKHARKRSLQACTEWSTPPQCLKRLRRGWGWASSQTLSVNEEKERHCFQHEKMTLQQGTWSRNASLTHREGPNWLFNPSVLFSGSGIYGYYYCCKHINQS